ncbi:MAG TPA: hypothetical protein VJ829_07280 [Candidatus Binatia bacterium]|nr:hypothetical protein [Candidatus Binatia bacterium]
MIKMRSEVLVPMTIFVAMLAAGCGSGGEDPNVRRAAERCMEQAQALTKPDRSRIEADCGKAQSYCNSDARRKEPLCQQFLLRYK